MPTLVDAHVHLTMCGDLDPTVRAKQLASTYEEAQAVIREHLGDHLAHGITAVRDGGDHGGHALRYALNHHNRSHMPITIAAAGKAWHAPGRYGRLIGRPPDAGQSLADAIGDIAEMGDLVKLVNSGLNSLTRYGAQTRPQFDLKEFRAGIAAAHSRGLKTMVHANGILPVGLSLDAGCDSIEHGFFMGAANLAKMAAGGAVWVPTAVTMQAYRDALLPKKGTPEPVPQEALVSGMNRDHQLRQLALAKSLGVRVAVGTDAGSPGVHHGNAIIAELRLMMKAGYNLTEAIQAACRQGALLLNLGDRGLLKPRMRADFIAVKGSPDQLPESLGAIGWLFLKGQAYRP
jgi:imidazolonepropionase-like amidohydrolase